MQKYLRFIYPLILISALAGLSNATYLNVLGPVSAVLHNNQSIYLGKVGPGESFYVLASASTTNATGFLVNIGWDRLNATNLPYGWQSQPSLLYENPMKLLVTVSPNAAYGIYNITLNAINVGNYSKLGNITVKAYVNVTSNVFNISASPTNIQTGPGQPENIYVTINNTGISDDPFSINLYGLPAWNVSYQVIALHHSSNTYVYPVYVGEPGRYSFNLTVSSAINPSAISISHHINLTANESLINDYGAVGQGVILSPVVFAPAYEFMLFLSYAYHAVFN